MFSSEPLSRPPWHFRLAKWLLRHGYPGGYRTIELAERLGGLDRVVRYPLTDRVTLDVPLGRRPNQWDLQDVQGYELALIDSVVATIASWAGPVTLIDCGADIGIFSALVVARAPQVVRIVAFEPNPDAFGVLSTNIERLPIAGEARQAAVSDFAGRGELRSPGWDDSDHARFLAPTEKGSVRVERVDDAESHGALGNLVLKLDVEGGEMAAIRGALTTLRAAGHFVVTIEAHPAVVERTRIDPVECLRLIQSVRPCRYWVAELPDLKIDIEQPFFRVRGGRICNIVCASAP
ncbi:MAG: FkbM family methyltransferase [Planctomycetia bacterium]|nr:FkbM family methyltransferase [Planctomycetia bacterium]